MKAIVRDCEQCKKYFRAFLDDKGKIKCPHCNKEWQIEESSLFQSCPFCKCDQFYRQKDFNHIFGCFLVAAGIIAVPFTYGISLPVVALLDYILYHFYPNMAVCYLCESDFHGFVVPDSMKQFQHIRAVKYETYREANKKK